MQAFTRCAIIGWHEFGILKHSYYSFHFVRYFKIHREVYAEHISSWVLGLRSTFVDLEEDTDGRICDIETLPRR